MYETDGINKQLLFFNSANIVYTKYLWPKIFAPLNNISYLNFIKYIT